MSFKLPLDKQYRISDMECYLRPSVGIACLAGLDRCHTRYATVLCMHSADAYLAQRRHDHAALNRRATSISGGPGGDAPPAGGVGGRAHRRYLKGKKAHEHTKRARHEQLW